MSCMFDLPGHCRAWALLLLVPTGERTEPGRSHPNGLAPSAGRPPSPAGAICARLIHSVDRRGRDGVGRSAAWRGGGVPGVVPTAPDTPDPAHTLNRRFPAPCVPAGDTGSDPDTN